MVYSNFHGKKRRPYYILYILRAFLFSLFFFIFFIHTYIYIFCLAHNDIVVYVVVFSILSYSLFCIILPVHHHLSECVCVCVCYDVCCISDLKQRFFFSCFLRPSAAARGRLPIYTDSRPTRLYSPWPSRLTRLFLSSDFTSGPFFFILSQRTFNFELCCFFFFYPFYFYLCVQTYSPTTAKTPPPPYYQPYNNITAAIYAITTRRGFYYTTRQKLFSRRR